MQPNNLLQTSGIKPAAPGKENNTLLYITIGILMTAICFIIYKQSQLLKKEKTLYASLKITPKTTDAEIVSEKKT